MRELLATHNWEDIDGIVAQTGCYTVSQMQVEDGWWPDNPIIPCAGESANGNRLQMLPVDSGIEGALGKTGQSIGSGLWAVSYTFKTAMEVLDGNEDVPHLRWYTGVEVTQDNVKLCENGHVRKSSRRAATPSSPASCRPTMPSTSGRPRCPSSASARPPKGSWTTSPEGSAARPP